MSNKTLIYSPDGAGGNGYNSGTFDPNLLLGMMFGGGGFGGFGGGNMLWPLFLLALWGIWGGGFGNFGGWGGNNGGGGCRGGFGFLSDQINNTAGRELLMQAITGNGNAISQLANQFGCKAGDIQNALQAISTQICQFSGQTGMGQQQIINALQMGDANLASQIAACCCDIKSAIGGVNVGLERGFSSVAYETQRQTCDIEKAISSSTAQIVEGQRAAEMRELMRENAALREEKSDLKTQRDLERQNQVFGGMIAQALAPVNQVLASVDKRVADIECNQPPVAKIPYVPAAGNYIPVNYSVPMHFGVSNYGGCGYNNYGGC